MTMTQRPVRLGGYYPDDLNTTLRVIRQFINDGSQNPDVILLARRITSGLPDRSTLTPDQQDTVEMYAVWKWVCDNIRYSRDKWEAKYNRPGEVLADCEAILKMRNGDCDEHVIITNALLLALGHRIEPRLGGVKIPSHIYSVAMTCKGNTICIDTTLKQKPFGTVPGTPEWAHWKIEEK